MPVDESLLLSYSPSKSEPKGTGKAALSASTCRRFAEDPHKFYLEKVEGLKEPPSIPLAVGIGVHEAMEEFLERYGGSSLKEAGKAAFRELRDGLSVKWDEVKDKTVRINREDPTNPRNREEIAVEYDDMAEWLDAVLWGLFESVESEVGEYKLLQAQKDLDAAEKPVGKMAREAGLPSSTIYSYDPARGKRRDMPVAVIAGVPVRGRADAICNWPGGGQVVIDHKCTSKVVPYYPPYSGGGGWKMYEPSDDAQDSLQLDLYSAASGIGRAAFQFLLRRPQHEPAGRLHPDWIDERVWRENESADGLPAMLLRRDRGLRYVGVWRPQPDDHASATGEFTAKEARKRAGRKLRSVAERMTESFILLQDGTDPKVAFPPGTPEAIGKKACPYCHYNTETGDCKVPMDYSGRSEKRDKAQSRRRLVEKREERCQEHARVQELRRMWENRYERAGGFLRP